MDSLCPAEGSKKTSPADWECSGQYLPQNQENNPQPRWLTPPASPDGCETYQNLQEKAGPSVLTKTELSLSLVFAPMAAPTLLAGTRQAACTFLNKLESVIKRKSRLHTISQSEAVKAIQIQQRE
jgi:hypothetical protein